MYHFIHQPARLLSASRQHKAKTSIIASVCQGHSLPLSQQYEKFLLQQSRKFLFETVRLAE